jgi:prevent-host-death family protein
VILKFNAHETIMKNMTAGKFKANCLAVIEEVQTTGEPVVITERGAAMVKVVPVTAEENESP